MPIFRPRIAIIGGGPSGLALGQLLYQSGIRATIYELRAKPTQAEIARPSGMLDLREESGLAAMRQCGLWDGIQAAIGDCTETTRILDPAGTVLHLDKGELSVRPEVPRNSLTNLIVQKLPSDMIKWQQKTFGVRSEHNATTGATEITVDLGVDGAAVHDFVIGADGAWSRVRKLLTNIQPIYTGAQFITATVRNVTTKFPHLLKVSGTGTLSALGGGNAILSQRGPQDSVRMYAVVSTPHEHWTMAMGLQGKTAAEIKTKLLTDDTLFAKWAPELQDLLATACDEDTRDNPGMAADIKPSYMLPIGQRWTHQAGTTLIGDAAHLMTPWAGEGVNLALWDALDLARVLTAVPEAASAAAWQEALQPMMRDFEETMFARAQEKAEETDQNRRMFLSEHGGQALADFFKSHEQAAASAAGPPLAH